MISFLSVEGYRRFKSLEVADLKPVNLLVGANNSGKSSVLEALFLLISRGSPESLWQLSQGRGELIFETGRSARTRLADVAHLFHGHGLQLDSRFSLRSEGIGVSTRRLTISIDEYRRTGPVQMTLDDDVGPPSLALRIDGDPMPDPDEIAITAKGGLFPPQLTLQHRLLRKGEPAELKRPVPVQFITAGSLEIRTLATLWNNIALTPDEERVLNALTILDPAIERIALQAESDPGFPSSRLRGGFIIRLRGHEFPIPIGSMGEGTWRMLAIAIAISQCKGGVLLIDEIDTGLHYSVLPALWRMVINSARELDVQVFATTHSIDCVRSLADLSAKSEGIHEEVSLQRVEALSPRTVAYDEAELEIASKNELEVR